MAASAAAYIANELYWESGDSASFGYPLPSVRVPVHNANFMAAALLSRIYHHTYNKQQLVPAMKAARYSADRQRPDGSWYYGEAPSQGWIDNFHTGYNLCALEAIGRYAEITEFAETVKNGVAFYRANFFREDGAVKYFHDRNYPIDTHCVAQSIITLVTFANTENLDLAQSVLAWALKHIWDERGFFYYRVLRSCKVRISYMRWSQAWMFLAIIALMEVSGRRNGRSRICSESSK
jgi:hypothetical protein